MVFGRGMIIKTPLIADWESIWLSKKIIIDKNNQKPNTYRIRDKVLARNKKENKYENPYIGPYPITQV